jgi:hypothetical protein
MILVTTKTANVEQLNLPWRVFAFQHPHLSVSLYGRAAHFPNRVF